MRVMRSRGLDWGGGWLQWRIGVFLAIYALVGLVTLGQPASSGGTQEEATSGEQVDLFSVLEDPSTARCLPPNTQEKVFIVVGAFGIFVLCFFLVIRLAERSFIQKDRSAILGRHWGISWTIAIVLLGVLGLVYMMTGCIHEEMYIWLGVFAAIWLVHLVYLFIVVSSD